MTVSAAALALACALVPIVVCIAAGAAIGRGRSRWPGADMLVGLGLAGGALTLLAVTARLPLSWTMLALALLAALAAVARRAVPGGRVTWVALALTLPVLLTAATSQAVLWDDFWQWLPNAAYAFRYDSLAWPDLPRPFAKFPGYPPTLPLMIAGASFVAGRFVETAGPVINVALLAGFCAVLADAAAAALTRRGRLRAGEAPIALVGLAVVVTLALNPGLNGAVVLSSYADAATAAAVGALGLLGVETLSRLSGRSAGDPAEMAWRFGFVAAALINLKQANPVLLALLVAGLALVAWRDPAIAARRALAHLPRMLGPAIILYAAWRWYLFRTGVVEQTFLPLGSWNFAALPRLSYSLRWNIVQAPFFHGLMWLVTVAGVALVPRLARKGSEACALAVVTAVVWVGYNAFLLFIYLAQMSTYDAEIAADYWRYTPHVALLGLAVPAMAVSLVRWPPWMRVRGSVVGSAAILLALAAPLARADLRRSEERAWPLFVRNVITPQLKEIIPAGSTLVLVLTHQYNPYQVIVPYDLWQLGDPARAIGTALWFPEDLESASTPPTAPAGGYLLIHDRDAVMDDLAAKIGVPPPRSEFVLYAARNGRWEKVKSWPIPPALIDRKE